MNENPFLNVCQTKNMYKAGDNIFSDQEEKIRKYLSFLNKICSYGNIRIFLNLIFGPHCHDNIVLLKSCLIVPDLELNIKG